MARVSVDTSDLKKFAAQLKVADRATKREYRKGLKEVGQATADDAKARIEDKSPETAALIKVRTRMPATVIVQGGSKDHPVAKLLEGNGTPGFWSHPLFGNEKERYAEQRQPHLTPAFEAHKGEAKDKLAEHVRTAMAEAGFHLGH
jgi:hypothetical protein